MLRVLSFALAFVFMVQSTAWATGEMTPESKMLLQKFVTHYNSLSVEARRDQVKKFLNERPVEDKNFISKTGADFSKLEFPKLELVGDKLSFTLQKNKITMKPFMNGVFEVNGKKIDFSPGKFHQAGDELAQMFTSKQTSVLDYFISSAHANGWFVTGAVGVVVAGIAAIAALVIGSVGLIIAAGVTALGAIGAFAAGGAENIEDMKKEMQELCNSIKVKVIELNESSTPSDVEEVKQALRDAKKEMSKSENCSNYPERCAAAKACLNDTERELNNLKAVDNSSRGQSKEDASPSSEQKKSSKASEQ